MTEIKVVVCKPYISAVNYGNNHLSECLYRERVDLRKLLEQYSNLVEILKQNDVVVEDIQPYYACDYCDLHLIANIMFTRDPVISTHRGIVVGKFRESVRDFENSIADICYDDVIGRVSTGNIEGGDFYQLSPDVCIIAHGNRTNMEGIHSLMKTITDNDCSNIGVGIGIERVVVVSFPRNTDQDRDMHLIHLDCYFGMAGQNVALLWEGATDFIVQEYVYNKAYNAYTLFGNKMTFRDYLNSLDIIHRVIEVPTSSQRNYGCNVLTIRYNVVLVQDKYVYDALCDCGADVVPTYVEFGEFHKMYGGIRCATQPCYT